MLVTGTPFHFLADFFPPLSLYGAAHMKTTYESPVITRSYRPVINPPMFQGTHGDEVLKQMPPALLSGLYWSTYNVSVLSLLKSTEDIAALRSSWSQKGDEGCIMVHRTPLPRQRDMLECSGKPAEEAIYATTWVPDPFLSVVRCHRSFGPFS